MADEQLSLRDTLAMSLSPESCQAIRKQSSSVMDEVLVGDDHPDRKERQPATTLKADAGKQVGGEETATRDVWDQQTGEQQLSKYGWELRVEAAIRYFYADAMLKAREKRFSQP